jgi:hypothetical protein
MSGDSERVRTGAIQQFASVIAVITLGIDYPVLAPKCAKKGTVIGSGIDNPTVLGQVERAAHSISPSVEDGLTLVSKRQHVKPGKRRII